jgi:ABC-type Fe3+/spermidine/putrescine transport system ATPase subunit
MTHVVLENLTKSYDGKTEAVRKLNLDMPNGEITALLGPSGSGKSTTLKMIAGLESLTAGVIYFDGEDVGRVPTEQRSAVMVFQNHLLFPHMSVAGNVGFGLKMRGVDRETRQKRVAEMLALVQLPGVGQRRPNQLSGGQQQRIALARALITEPKVLLLDEPLSNLDVHLRDEMRDLILCVQRETAITTVLVTHDQQEAVLLADQIALMFDGELQQVGPPSDFYRVPKTERVARFFGGLNFFPATVDGSTARTAFGAFQMAEASAIQGAALLTIRPEQIQLGVAVRENTVQGIVTAVIYGGTTTRYKVDCDGQVVEMLRAADLPGTINGGDVVMLRFPPEHLWTLAEKRPAAFREDGRG